MMSFHSADKPSGTVENTHPPSNGPKLILFHGFLPPATIVMGGGRVCLVPGPIWGGVCPIPSVVCLVLGPVRERVGGYVQGVGGCVRGSGYVQGGGGRYVYPPPDMGPGTPTPSTDTY